MTTEVTDVLDANGISYKIKRHNCPAFTCVEAARERKVRLSQIAKCMIGKDNKGQLHVMLIPGDKILKLKRVRQVAGGIPISLVDAEILERDHDLIVGAISPLQFLGKAQFYLDNSMFREEHVDISSGDLSAGVELRLDALSDILNAVRCDIISTSSTE